MESLHPPVAAPGEQSALAPSHPDTAGATPGDLWFSGNPLSDAGSTGKAYSAATWLSAPLVALHLLKRYAKGRETAVSLQERWTLGGPPEADGKPLVWFHAVSIGESAVALPLVHRCLQEHPEVSILFTTSTVEAYQLLSDAVPKARVSLRFAPLDVPWVVDRFLAHWNPVAGIFVESELWPNLICRARARGVHLALLNARMSSKSFLRWHKWTRGRDLVGSALSCFSLIVPQSDLDVGRFRLLGAQLWQMPGWCADLKYAAAMGACVWQMWRPKQDRVDSLAASLSTRPCWVAASTHEGEEGVVGRVHHSLEKLIPDLLTIVVPRHPWRCGGVKAELEADGLNVMLWTSDQLKEDAALLDAADVLLVDAVGELPLIFSVAEVAFVGGSLFHGSRGHNLAEAAVAGCAVLVGPHAGHFSRMAEELNEAGRESSYLYATGPPFSSQEQQQQQQQQQQQPQQQYQRITLDPRHSPMDSPFTGTPRTPGASAYAAFGSSPEDGLRRSLHRRRVADRDPEQQQQQQQYQTPPDLTSGLEELSDDVSERWEHVNMARRETHLGGTPSNEWMRGRPGTAGSESSSAPPGSSQLQYLGSHRASPVQVGNGSSPGSPTSSRVSTPLRAGSLTPRRLSAWQSSTWPPRDEGPGSSSAAGATRDSSSEDIDDLLRDASASLQNENGVSFSHTLRMRQQQMQQVQQLPSMSSPVMSRYPPDDIVAPHFLPSHPIGPCIWTVEDEADLAAAVGQLLEDSRERRSRGRAAAQASAILAENLVTTVWDILDLKVISPAIEQAMK